MIERNMTFIEKFSMWTVAVVLIVALVGLVGYVRNVVKIFGLDFQPPYKAEIIRGIGLFPLAGAVVGWMKIEDR